MALLPTDVPTRLVTSTMYFVNEDSVDDNTNPEYTVVTGSVVFTASPKVIRMPSKPALFVPLEFEGVFNADGQLVPKNGTGVGMELIVTDSTLLNPRNWTWTVSFNLKVAGTKNTVNIDSFSFQLPEGEGSIDLVQLMPVAASNGVLTIQGSPGSTGESAYATAVKQGFLGTEEAWLASLKGPKGDPGPGGGVTDASVAAVLDAPLTKAALNGTIVDQVSRADTFKRAKLRRFWEALAKGSCNVYIPGDSWTEGTRGADLPNLRYVDHLQNAIRAAAPNPIGGQYIPAWTTYPTRQPTNWVYTGVSETGGASETGKKEGSGMGFFNRELPVGATASLTFTGTGFRIHMDRRPDGATVEVRVDGALVTTYNTSNPTDSNSEYRDYVGYVPGVHTLQLTVVAGSGAVFSLQGAYVYNTDESKGVRVYPAGRGGVTAKKFMTDNSMGGQLSAVIPDLVIFGLGGINDWRTGVSATEFETALRNGVAAIRSRPLMAGASLVFLKFPQTQSAGTPVNTWAEYRAKVDLVAADVGGLVVDLEPIFGPGELNNLSPLVNADKVHPEDPGHLAIATTIAQAILPPKVPGKAQTEQFVVPASEFQACDGTPSAQVVNTTYYGWLLDKDVTEGVIAELNVPSSWKSFNVDLWFMNFSIGTGAVRLRSRIKKLPLGGSISVSNDESKTLTAKAQYVLDRSYGHYPTPIVTAPDTLMYLHVQRDATNVADTLTNDLVFLKAVIRRVN